MGGGRTLTSLRIPSHRGRSGHVLHHRLIHNTTNGAQSIYENIDIYPHVIAGHRACLGAVVGCLSALAFLYSHFMHSIFGTPEPSFFVSFSITLVPFT